MHHLAKAGVTEVHAVRSNFTTTARNAALAAFTTKLSSIRLGTIEET